MSGVIPVKFYHPDPKIYSIYPEFDIPVSVTVFEIKTFWLPAGGYPKSHRKN